MVLPGGVEVVLGVDEVVVDGAEVVVVGGTETGTVVGGTVLRGVFAGFGAAPGGAGVLEGAVLEGAADGDVQPEGGWLGPCWPGMRTVPAQPKFDSITSSTTVPPSEKWATEATSRM